MSEKVVLTKEQAEAISWLKDEEYSVGDILNSHIYGWSAKNTACLNDLKISQIAEVLYTENYEVKETFKPGDKVITVWEGQQNLYTLETVYLEISNAKEGKGWQLVGENFGIHERHIRHATPEEIYWLDTLGREEIGDFREADVFVDSANRAYGITSKGTGLNFGAAKEWYRDGDFKGIYPAESFKPFPKEESK